MRRDPPPSYNDTWCGLFLSFIITFLFITSVLYILFDTFDNYISILSYYLSRRQSWFFCLGLFELKLLRGKKGAPYLFLFFLGNIFLVRATISPRWVATQLFHLLHHHFQLSDLAGFIIILEPSCWTETRSHEETTCMFYIQNRHPQASHWKT